MSRFRAHTNRSARFYVETSLVSSEHGASQDTMKSLEVYLTNGMSILLSGDSMSNVSSVVLRRVLLSRSRRYLLSLCCENNYMILILQRRPTQ